MTVPRASTSIVRRERPSTFIFGESAQRVNPHPVLLQPLPTWQVRQLDYEAALDDVRVHLLDERQRRERGATCREQLIEDDDARALRDAIDVRLDAVRAVFELVVVTDRCGGELARLADRYEP